MKLKNWIVHIYLFLMLGIFPLYYQDKYFNMGDAKYQFFKYATIALLCLIMAVQVVERILGLLCSKDIKVRNIRSLFSIQDIAVLMYMFAVLFSWLLSPYREGSWIGSHEWYMGLLSQILFWGIYFCVSRYGRNSNWILCVMEISAAIVFLISYLHRFRIDPLGMYEGVSEALWIAFLGTIGNANWYSSYICVVLPIMMGIYMFGNQKCDMGSKFVVLLEILLLFLGFATTVTQNSDSVYIGLALAFLFCFWFSLENLTYFRRLFEVLLIGLLACKFTGYLQVTYPEKAIQVTTISTTLSQGSATWVLLGIICLLYFILKIVELQFRENEEQKYVFLRKVRKIRWGIFAFTFISLIIVLTLMWFVTTGKMNVESGFLSQTGYLNFNDTWGSNRGGIWKYAIKVFREYPLKMKLFGCGPDALMHYTNEFHQAEIQAVWGNVILTNVHNEWLNMMINCGITGAVAYLAIFITIIVRVVRNWRTKPMLIAFAAAVIGYMGHNFFCFQQVVCTPLVFIMIGMAENDITKSREAI